MEQTLPAELLIRDHEPGLRRFIRKWVSDEADAQDILQDVWYEFLEAQRFFYPIDHIGAWLIRVARNRIIDRFRKKTPETLALDDLLPSPDEGPEAAYARTVLLEELDAALDELPDEQ